MSGKKVVADYQIGNDAITLNVYYTFSHLPEAGFLLGSHACLLNLRYRRYEL